jgi:uncharacterized protein YjiS (DUF1127 family)
MRFMHCCGATLSLFKRPSILIFRADQIHRRPPPVTTSRGIAMFAHAVRLIRAWKRYHQSLSELNRLGDRELADIGISRSDIPRVAWNASHKL